MRARNRDAAPRVGPIQRKSDPLRNVVGAVGLFIANFFVGGAVTIGTHPSWYPVVDSGIFLFAFVYFVVAVLSWARESFSSEGGRAA